MFFEFRFNIFLLILCLMLTVSIGIITEADLCKKAHVDQSLQLLKSGFHRELQIDCHFKEHLSEDVVVLLVLTIPPGMYVDPYELEYLKNLEFSVNVSIDVEVPEYKSRPSSLYIYLPVQNNEAHVKFPIHIRYHKPHWCNKNDVASRNDDLQSPKIYMKMEKYTACKQLIMDFKCSPTSKMNCPWILVETNQVDNLQYEIPVGCREHQWTVLIGTAVSFFFGFIYILYIVLKVTNKKKLS